MDIRVHTVGKQLFASEVITEATDYRYAGRVGAMRNIRAVEITPELAGRCLNLADKLGLVMSGIDLRRTLDGDYACFEVNTSPAFTFYENYTGQRIGDAVADLLCQGQVH